MCTFLRTNSLKLNRLFKLKTNGKQKSLKIRTLKLLLETHSFCHATLHHPYSIAINRKHNSAQRLSSHHSRKRSTQHSVPPFKVKIKAKGQRRIPLSRASRKIRFLPRAIFFETPSPATHAPLLPVSQF